LQYVIGLAKLGHEVYYHEDTWSWPYHPLERQYTSDGAYSARFIRDFFRLYAPELEGRWHYLHLHETGFGMERALFDEVARSADLFLNVSGASMIPDHLSSRCVKVFLDTDPGYNQIVLSEKFAWSENIERWCAGVADHDRHFTYAENIHSSDCLIPKLGFAWKTTRMPVAVNLWDSVARQQPPATGAWSTVMTWNAFKGKLIYEEEEYQSKGREFEKLIELPSLVRLPLKVAVGGVNAPMKRLASCGWDVVDGPRATLKPDQYQAFIAESRGEISAAKHVYAAMRTGWFSCRSACYLAACRPVVLQDTGFHSALPVGEGILQFQTIVEAAEAIREVERKYKRHAEAARTIAEKYFDSDRVLNRLLEEALDSD
jgi:hypothetical protein